MVSDLKGPLPPNWEIAYSEQGEKYFIDHNSGTTHWDDPRDLPDGWEKVDDGIYGTFYVDHINKRTQYEWPTGPAVETTSVDHQDLVNIAAAAATTRASTHTGSNFAFTRNPSHLCGQLITTRIVKGPKGLGFTLIGGDLIGEHEEFLQIKSVISGGPAHRDGIVQMGDIIVYVNNECLLGATQAYACRIFQKIGVGELVTLQVCRGYPLLIDPTNKIILENAYFKKQSNDDEREIVINKCKDGFGFTIFESVQGQRVKKILYPERCENLLEGDILLEMRTTHPHGTPNNPIGQERLINFRFMPHHELVSTLRECPVGFWAKLIVRRNISTKHRSQTPTATFHYSEQQRANNIPSILPRLRTPAPHPPRPTKSNSSNFLLATNGSVSKSYICGARNTIPRQHDRRANDKIYENFSNLRPSSTSLGFSTPNYVPMNVLQNPDAELLTVNLIRKPNGFGFRLVGGTEEGTPIIVGQIVVGGAAADDGRLKQGDKIIEIDGKNVVGDSHAIAVQLIQKSASNGHVKLLVQRSSSSPHSSDTGRDSTLALNEKSYDVILNRNAGDGFGFVIISSINNNGSTIGKIIDGSPAAQCGLLNVGDQVIAVNGISIVDLPHNDVVSLIKKSGLSVRLSIASIKNDVHCCSVSQSESAYARVAPDNGTPSQLRDNQFEASSQCSMYQGQGGNFCTSRFNPETGQQSLLLHVELNRGPKGFGFSIRGGKEFDSMPLFVLRIADDGPASLDGRLKVGDQLIEINGQSTQEMTHSRAIQIIKQYPTVQLLLRRSQGF